MRERDASRGQSLVEFALVLPLLLVIFAGAADFGRLFYGFVALENSVKEGALYGARYPLCATSSTLCPNPDNVTWRVRNEARTVQNPDGTPITPSSSCVDDVTGAVWSTPAELKNCEAGDTYVVQATYRFNLITPLLGQMMGGSFTLASESRALVLNQAFDPTPGLAPTKLIRAEDARNKAEIRANCEQPDPTGSPDYYRSPCVDVVEPIGPNIQATFRTGDQITYKIIVRNNGGTNVTSVTMTDSQGWPSCPTKPTMMPVNGTPYVCTYTRTAPTVGGAGTTTTFQNDLTVTGQEISPTTDSAIVTIEKPPADLRVLKFVSVYKEGSDGDGWVGGSASFGNTQSLSVYRNGSNPSVSVWYKIIVTNQGGQTATGVSVSDSNASIPFGQNNASAVCDSAPSSLAVGARWECRYRVTFNSSTTRNNTARATATNVTPDANDDSVATVTVDDCTGSNKLVPSMIGMTKSQAQTAWTNAGFTGAMSGGSNGNPTVAQDRQAYSCLPAGTTITISDSVTNT